MPGKIKYVSKAVMFLLPAALICLGCTRNPSSVTYAMADETEAKQIFLDPAADSLIIWAANDLADDIGKITGSRPQVVLADTAVQGILIGQCGSRLIGSSGCEIPEGMEGSWEQFHIRICRENLVITGSDIRGTVYGIFDIAERLGISPWKWWADVNPLPRETMKIEIPDEGITEKPSVKYRGIFINDEDWGMQPWAAKTFEPETGDIGPRTYEQIFRLLLRLKANTIWPAMHPCTEAFYRVPGNNEMAIKYNIVVGTSHCEPMLRNNVDEWDEKTFGDYNFFSNRSMVCDYWQSRIAEVSRAENIVTLGMRGVHDGSMEGGNSDAERMAMLEEIMDTQRAMLQKVKGKSTDSISQAIVLYKEVLDYYNMGLKVPDDVTLMWCDDNYGYIRRLSNEEEQKRSGGSGVYYHLSYWGRPHDYLWLSTTQPGLIWYEMSRAYENGARNIWIANVGDLKPAEYNMEFFLDLAWDIHSVSAESIHRHMKDWAGREFGPGPSEEIAGIMDEYYRLAFHRRPEFMGWSQTEPTTPVHPTGFNPALGEVRRRIDAYRDLLDRVEALKPDIPAGRRDAFFQLVEYKVKGAALMNHKFLYAKLAADAENTVSREDFILRTRKAHDEIRVLTEYYNGELSGGKWNHMMSATPRNLPVFDFPEKIINSTGIAAGLTKDPSPAQRIFIRAYDYNSVSGVEKFTWHSVKGLGYSGKALTLFPFCNHYFDSTALPFIDYTFHAKKAGEFGLQVRCLPTHSNHFDQKLGIRLDDGSVQMHSLNTMGRSRDWKINVLRNSQIIRQKFLLQEPGDHLIRLYVNQTGIVIDQLAIDFAMDENFYEIPLNSGIQ